MSLTTPALRIALASIVLFSAWQPSSADTGSVVQVEETWELTVGEPNTSRNAPQLTMGMSPSGDFDGKFFVFLVNHRTAPNYVPGGMQVQIWNGEHQCCWRTGPTEGSIDETNDTISWTQRMSIENGAVTFEVRDGQSATWGSFGGQGYLRTSFDTALPDLNLYHPFKSLEESGISYAGNRVTSLTLKHIKWWLANGQVFEYTAPFDIDNDLDPWD